MYKFNVYLFIIIVQFIFYNFLKCDNFQIFVQICICITSSVTQSYDHRYHCCVSHPEMYTIVKYLPNIFPFQPSTSNSNENWSQIAKYFQISFKGN